MTTPDRLQHPTASTNMLDGARRMDPVQWGRLVNSFGPVVFAWCKKSGVPDADCPDVVQDVFVSVARGVERFQRVKAEGSFRSWLATITRTRVCDYFRSLKQTPAATGGSDAQQRLESLPDNFEDSLSTDAASGIIVSQLLSLVEADFAEKTWQAFWLTTIDCKTVQEVAQSLGISDASVYQARSRVLRRLREEVNRLPS